MSQPSTDMTVCFQNKMAFIRKNENFTLEYFYDNSIKWANAMNNICFFVTRTMQSNVVKPNMTRSVYWSERGIVDLLWKVRAISRSVASLITRAALSNCFDELFWCRSTISNCSASLTLPSRITPLISSLWPRSESFKFCAEFTNL